MEQVGNVAITRGSVRWIEHPEHEAIGGLFVERISEHVDLQIARGSVALRVDDGLFPEPLGQSSKRSMLEYTNCARTLRQHLGRFLDAETTDNAKHDHFGLIRSQGT